MWVECWPKLDALCVLASVGSPQMNLRPNLETVFTASVNIPLAVFFRV